MKGIPELIAAIAAEDREMAHAVAPTLLKLDKDVSKWNEGRPGKKNLSVTEILAGAMGKMGRGGDTALEFVNPQEQELLKMAGSKRSQHPLLGVTENISDVGDSDTDATDDASDSFGGDSSDYSDNDGNSGDTGVSWTDPDLDSIQSEDYTASELADVGIDPTDLFNAGSEGNFGSSIKDFLNENLKPGTAVANLFGLKRGGSARQGLEMGGAFGGPAGLFLGAMGGAFDSLRDSGVDVEYGTPDHGYSDWDGNSDNFKGKPIRLAQTPTSLPDAIEMPQGLNLTGTPLQQRAQLATLALYGGQGQGVARSKAGQDFYRNLAARTLTGDNERLPIDIQYMRDILGETV